MALTVADLNRLMEQVKTDKVRAASNGSSDKLSYIVYNEDGTPNYRNTLIAVLATTAGLSELNKLRIIALYDTSSTGGYDNIIQQITSINNTITDLKAQLNTIEAQIAGIGTITTDVSSIKTQLSELQSLYTSLTSQYNDLNSEIETLKINIDSIDIESISDKISNNETNISNINDEINKLKEQIAAIEAGGSSPSTGGLEERVKTVEDSIVTINEKLNAYDETIQQINYNVSQALQAATNAQSTASNLYNTVASNTTSIGTIQTDIRNINTQITQIKEQLTTIQPGSEVDLSDYVTQTEMTNKLTSMVASLRGATIYNLHIIGWHDDASMEFSAENYPDASNNNEYFEQYGMIAAKEVTSKSQLLGFTVNASTVATWLSDVMYVDTIDEVWNMIQQHSILTCLGYGKPKCLAYSFDGTTIKLDTYWGFDKGCIIRCNVSASGVSFEELIDFKDILDRITTLETKVASMQTTVASNTSRISSLESRVNALE